MAVLPAPVGFLANGHLPLVSRRSACKDDDEMKPCYVHRSPGIYLMTEENPGKPQLGDRLMKAVRPVIASNGVLFLQMTSVGSHNMSGILLVEGGTQAKGI